MPKDLPAPSVPGQPNPAKQSPRANRRSFIQSTALAGLGSLLLKSRGGAAESPRTAVTPTAPVATGSDVGSLYPFIDRQRVRGEFPLSFLNARFRSLPAWKKKARARVFELLHYNPPPCAPNAETLERIDCGEYFREHIVFNTTPDIRVPAIVLVPKNARTPLPALVVLHDHGGFYFWGKEKVVQLPNESQVLIDFKHTYYGDRSIATELVRQGYLTITIDMFYWGERRMLLDADPEDWRTRPASITRERVQAFNSRASQNEALVGRTIYSAGFTWSGVMFWDDIRTVDYLRTRSDVDRNRIGCVGLSVGGLRSCHLAALDSRIRAAVIVGWMTSFPWQLKNHIRNSIGFTKLVPGLYQHLDFPDVASLAMPAPMLVINGSRDGLFHPQGVRASFDKLHACYAKAGHPEKCVTSMYDTPHEFNRDMQSEAWNFLKKWLRPS